MMGLLGIEQNMRLRRGRILSVLNEDEMAPTLVAFPLLLAWVRVRERSFRHKTRSQPLKKTEPNG